MPMTQEQKDQAKANLRKELEKLKSDTLDYWLHLFREGEEFRKHSGFSQGPEDMLKKLSKAYYTKLEKLMKPFDRGDYD
jgi:hypothetical protein